MENKPGKGKKGSKGGQWGTIKEAEARPACCDLKEVRKRSVMFEK